MRCMSDTCSAEIIAPVVCQLQTLKYLGDVNIALKNRPVARKYYNRALRILKRRLGGGDETVRQLESYVFQLNLDNT
jgi:hypothetical protein